jgi:hypothetical protein
MFLIVEGWIRIVLNASFWSQMSKYFDYLFNALILGHTYFDLKLLIFSGFERNDSFEIRFQAGIISKR